MNWKTIKNLLIIPKFRQLFGINTFKAFEKHCTTDKQTTSNCKKINCLWLKWTGVNETIKKYKHTYILVCAREQVN